MDDALENVTVPDSPEGLVSPRYYRKMAQDRMVRAMRASAGRSGLSQAEKVAQLQEMQTLLAEALEAVTSALGLMETAD
jgi:hypothetical protein